MTLTDLVSSALRERAARAPDPDAVSAAALVQGRKRRTRRRVAGVAGVVASTGLVFGGVALAMNAQQVPLANQTVVAKPSPFRPVQPDECPPDYRPEKAAVVFAAKRGDGDGCVVVMLMDGKVPDTWPVAGGIPLGPPDKCGERVAADGRTVVKRQAADHWLAATTPAAFPVAPNSLLSIALEQSYLRLTPNVRGITCDVH